MSEKTPVKLAYTIYESKNGANSSLPPIVFLHCLILGKNQWENTPQLVADQTKRKCYAVDARNHGDSEYTDFYNIHANAVDLLHFLDTIHAEKAILVGSSIGGSVAIETALYEPNRVEKIIVIDVHAKKCSEAVRNFVINYLNSWINAVNQLPKDIPLEKATTRFLDFMYSSLPPNKLVTTKEEKKRPMGKTLYRKPDGTYGVKCNLTALLEYFKNYDTVENEFRGRFDGPAMFMLGELSPVYVGIEEEANKSVRKHFPNAEIVKFKDATHSLMYEFPELFLRTMITFLLK